MSSVLRDVLEHTLNLVHFCKKVGIPFKVYSFTSNYSLEGEDVSQSDMEFDMKGLVLAELFSSEMTAKQLSSATDSHAIDVRQLAWQRGPHRYPANKVLQ